MIREPSYKNLSKNVKLFGYDSISDSMICGLRSGFMVSFVGTKKYLFLGTSFTVGSSCCGLGSRTMVLLIKACESVILI